MQRAKLNPTRTWARVECPAVVVALEWLEDPHALTAIATAIAPSQFDRGHPVIAAVFI
jgi:hypothetical protein